MNGQVFMHAFTLTHLSDAVLLRDLAALLRQDGTTTAALLAHLAEVDARRLYLPAACPSMFVYCVRELGLSEDSAFKRIRAARTAREFPAIFAALADGQLHLSAVVLLTPYLTQETADDLLAAASHKSKAEIEQLLAQRFPRPDLPARVQAIPPPAPSILPTDQLAPGPVEGMLLHSTQLTPGHVEAPEPPKVAPLSPQRFALQVTIGQGTHDHLRYAQALLSHQIPSGDVAEVLDRALKALIHQLEKTKFAATTRPRPRRRAAGGRHIPADVRRTVWERDRRQCTFVSEAGHRCPARTFLEFDHMVEVARGGQATSEGIRLRCRAHNQYGAECTFGAEFMRNKREAARHAAAETRTRAAAAEARARAAAQQEARDVMAGLRELGFRAEEASRAAEFSETLPDATLEERMRAALQFLCPKPRFPGRIGTSVGAST